MSRLITSIRKPLVILLAFFMLACQNEEEEVQIPAHVLSREKYAKLLVDFSLAESAGNLNIKNLSGARFDSAYAFNPLKENNVSAELYDSTVSFYSRHPEIFKEIHEEALNLLSKMLSEREKIKKDSVPVNKNLADTATQR